MTFRLTPTFNDEMRFTITEQKYLYNRQTDCFPYHNSKIQNKALPVLGVAVVDHGDVLAVSLLAGDEAAELLAQLPVARVLQQVKGWTRYLAVVLGWITNIWLMECQVKDKSPILDFILNMTGYRPSCKISGRIPDIRP